MFTINDEVMYRTYRDDALSIWKNTQIIASLLVEIYVKSVYYEKNAISKTFDDIKFTDSKSQSRQVSIRNGYLL